VCIFRKRKRRSWAFEAFVSDKAKALKDNTFLTPTRPIVCLGCGELKGIRAVPKKHSKVIDGKR